MIANDTWLTSMAAYIIVTYDLAFDLQEEIQEQMTGHQISSRNYVGTFTYQHGLKRPLALWAADTTVRRNVSF